MPSNFLKEKLTQAAQKSPTFQSLPLEKQAELISNLENASDPQAIEAIKTFEEDQNNSQNSELAKQQQEQKLTETAVNLEQEIKDTKTEMEKVDQIQEEASHQTEMTNLESQISNLTAPAPATTPKRKKFLGIF